MEQGNFDLTGATTQATDGVTATTDAAGMTFDLNGVDDAPAFEVLPKGTYNAIVEEFEFTTSKTSGNPMIQAIYSITDPEFENRKIYDYYVLAGDGAKYALPRLKQLITRVCPDVDSSQFNPQAFADAGTIINRPCRLKLAIQTQKKGEYAGEKRNTVREILASDGGSEASFLG